MIPKSTWNYWYPVLQIIKSIKISGKDDFYNEFSVVINLLVTFNNSVGLQMFLTDKGSSPFCFKQGCQGGAICPLALGSRGLHKVRFSQFHCRKYHEMQGKYLWIPQLSACFINKGSHLPVLSLSLIICT